MTDAPTIIYTETDEAPALATYSLLPILRAFTKQVGVRVETRDISLAGRILASFRDKLPADQQRDDALSELGALAQTPEANIIKLPNVSASLPQLKAAIAELQKKGFALPDYPDQAQTAEEKDHKARYDRVKGSAVNPVLREGNSDRRAPKAVKEYARKNPHSMGAWNPNSRSHVATMSEGDFCSNEKSITVPTETVVSIVFESKTGEKQVLKESIPLLAGEVFDSTVLSRAKLLTFLEEQIEDAKKSGVLFSLHMKATMMKISDPIIFGHCVRVFFKDVFEKHGATLERIGASPGDGLGAVLGKLAQLDESERKAIEADISAAYESGPALAMVDSDRGITNLHVPSDVIIDASMPAMIRTSGQMWNRDGKPQDTKARQQLRRRLQ